MSRPQDFFGADPKSVLNKPFFHCQDQKAYNVDGGTSIADAWTKRTLNTVLQNTIQGAVLSSDEVTLPAGDYYIEGSCQVAAYSVNNSCLCAIFIDGVKALQGQTHGAANPGIAAAYPFVDGKISLSYPSVIQLKYYTGYAWESSGLGISNNYGTITDATIPSIYADLKIWQLDKSLEIAPRTVNSGLQTVNGLDTTGNIMGFNITKTGANQLTISKGSCSDSTLLEPLAFTADKTLNIPAIANTIYHIFIVKLVAGGYEPRAYTSEAAILSDNQVSYFRWIGLCQTDGAGGLFDSYQYENILTWYGEDRPTGVSAGAAGTVTMAVSSILPLSRILSVGVGPTTSITLTYAVPGKTLSAGRSTYSGHVAMLPPVASLSVYFSGAGVAVFYSLVLRR